MNNYLFFVILIFLILLFLIFNYKPLKIDNIENMQDNFIGKRDKINFLKYNTNLTKVAFDPNGIPLDFMPKDKYYNFTMVYYLFLLQLFQILSINKKEYNKILIKNYPKNTLDFNTLDILNYYIKPLLLKINEVSLISDFRIVNFESYKVYKLEENDFKLHEIDFFVYDKRGEVELRLILELVEVPDEKKKFNPKYETCAQRTTPSIPKYFIGYPAKNQFIPLPSQVIITGKDVLSDVGTDYPIPCPFQKIWINSIQIINSNLALGALENFGVKDLPGANDLPFEYTVWNGGNNPYYFPAKYRNKWPTINTQPKKQKAWPCTPVPFKWNFDGVQPKVHPTKNCPGIRSSLREQKLTASYNPNMFDYPRKQNEYTWLFDNAQNIPSIMYNGG